MRAGIGGGLAAYGQDVQEQGMAALAQASNLERQRETTNKKIEQQNRAGNAQIGATVGSAAGMAIGGPIGGMIGGLAGGLIGGLF
jgi:uncharacterized membrane protein